MIETPRDTQIPQVLDEACASGPRRRADLLSLFEDQDRAAGAGRGLGRSQPARTAADNHDIEIDHVLNGTPDESQADEKVSNPSSS